MTFPQDYQERVYAGVLGKLIGVYLGRPFEGWPYARILSELGEINGYVHEKRGMPLIVTDDDISGTFTFLRALEDHGDTLEITPEQIGETWLNYLIEGKTILWWGGLGNSTEHTAYLRLKHGIPAPESGSIARNGPIVAQQIGAQIFIDGWAMAAPGDPLRAADLARRAASVSHDGEAVYGAQALAAMESMAFIEQDINRLLDAGLAVIPSRSLIARMIGDLREWHAADGDWHTTFHRIEETYGYRDYIGGCHIVPNHALIVLGLLYGEGDFGKSLMVCNTCGWDTDCNSGNLGCLMGIRNGLAGIDASAYDWRGPVADRMFLPTMDGGRCITDAVQETYRIANTARRMNGLPPELPKAGARFHFELPGSVQSFQGSVGARVENVAGHSKAGSRSLAIHLAETQSPLSVTTPTFVNADDRKMPGYSLIASPTLYPGETLRILLTAADENTTPLKIRPLLRFYNTEDQPAERTGADYVLAPGKAQEISWQVPDLHNQPIYAVGIQADPSTGGTLYLDTLTWNDTVKTTFARPQSGVSFPGPSIWREAWVKALDQWETWSQDPFKLIQNNGRGLLITGRREWRDYRVQAVVKPALLKAGGLAVRVQGLRRYYALELTGEKTIRLIRMLDGQQTILEETAFTWELWQPVELSVEVRGSTITGWAAGSEIFRIEDPGSPLVSGAVGFALEEGHIMAEYLKIEAC